jgi:hypothetical protein
MATARQMEANRLNAKNSTGPKTPEGKAKSSMNRLTHGFASSSFITPEENGHEFIALLDDLTAEHRPMTPTEQILVEKMAQNHWLTQRALNLQGEAFLALSLDGQSSAVPANLGLLIRYHTAAERAFHRAHNELVKVQKERRNSEIGFEPQESPEPADIPPAPPKTGPKTAPMNDETTPSDEKIVPETPKAFKKAA